MKSKASDAVNAFARGFRQGWREQRLSSRTLVTIATGAAIVTAAGLILARAAGQMA